MNDFTKEELELTMELYQEFMKKYEFPESVDVIVSKIQSMIDSYCEHEFEKKSVELHAKQCCKCQEVKVL